MLIVVIKFLKIKNRIKFRSLITKLREITNLLNPNPNFKLKLS